MEPSLDSILARLGPHVHCNCCLVVNLISRALLRCSRLCRQVEFTAQTCLLKSFLPPTRLKGV